MLSPRYYVDCNACRDSFPIKGKYKTVYDVRSERGGIFPLKCPHCGKTKHYSYNKVEAVPPLSAIGSIVAVISVCVVIPLIIFFLTGWISYCFGLKIDNSYLLLVFPASAIVLMIVYGLVMSKAYGKMNLFNKSKKQAPAPILTKDVAEAMSDEELLDWTFSNDVVLYSLWTRMQESDLEYYKEDLVEVMPKIIESYDTIGATKHAELARQMETAVYENIEFIEKCYDEFNTGGAKAFYASQLYKDFEKSGVEADKQEPIDPLLAAYIRSHLDEFCTEQDVWKTTVAFC